MYLSKNDITTLHLEFTSLCNASCPQCGRTDNKSLPLDSITIEQVKEWFSPSFVSQLRHMYSCGNVGDPIVNPDCLEIVKYFKDNGCDYISLHTNGGVRDLEFWRELGKLNTRVVFAIDGLEDTNHIYRVGVRWERLMENVKTFINAGGIAIWAYLLFSHNEHQLDEAHALSQQLGFYQFKPKASGRFEDKSEVLNKYKQKITAATASNVHAENRKKAVETYSSWDNYLEQTPIKCKTQQEKSLYVDFNGDVWPCCWLGLRYVKDGLQTMEVITSKYDLSMLSLKHNTLDQILTSPWFARDIESHWEPGKNRLITCATTCGGIYKPSSDIITK